MWIFFPITQKTLIYARDVLPFVRQLSRDERMKIEDFHLSCAIGNLLTYVNIKNKFYEILFEKIRTRQKALFKKC